MDSAKRVGARQPRDSELFAVRRSRFDGLAADLPPIRFEDLAATLAGGLEPPAQVVEGLIVDRQVHWLAGHPAHGKTTVALWSAVTYMKRGGHVVWFDWEAGERDTLLRLRALGADPDTIIQHFHYANSPRIPADEDGLALLQDALRPWSSPLVVFDSASKALSIAGLDENNPAEATRWTTETVMPLRDLGATILVIDHVQKTASRSNPYPRGAGSKLADTEVAWFVEAIEPFNRSQVGELRLTKHKDRSGVLPAEMRLKVGDGQGNLPVEVIEGAGESDGRGDKEHQLRQRVVEALREHGELNVTQLKELVKGNASQVVATARELAHDPREPVGVGTGPRQSVIYRYDAAEAVPLVRKQLEAANA